MKNILKETKHWDRVRTMKREAKNTLKRFWKEEDGMGSVEIILIVVILIGLVILFKDSITEVVKNAIKQIESDAKEITG